MKQIFKNKFIVAVVTALALVASAPGMTGMAGAQETVRDHSANSIIRGGATSPNEFIDKARANNPADLQGIYEAYGLHPSEYDAFFQHAQRGVAHKNGDITVDGKVVARDARSLGRERKPYSTNRSIGNATYYESRNQDIFRSDTIPVMVLLDRNGRFQTGILTACANPVRAIPVHQPKPAERDRPEPVRAPVREAPVREKPVREKPAPVKPVETRIPADFQCTGLRANRTAGGTELDQTFTVTVTRQNAQLSYVDFDYGDGAAVHRVVPTNASDLKVSARHVYAQPGTYSVRATTYFAYSKEAGPRTVTASSTAAGETVYVNTAGYTSGTGTTTGSSTVSNGSVCETQVTVAQSQPAVLSAVSPVATTPQAPAILPVTGVGEFIALFTTASVIGTVGYYLYTKRRLARL